MIKSWKHLLAKFKFKMLVLMTFILKVRIVIYTVVNSCIQSKNKLSIYLTIQTQVKLQILFLTLVYPIFSLHSVTSQY